MILNEKADVQDEINVKAYQEAYRKSYQEAQGAKLRVLILTLLGVVALLVVVL